MIKQRGAAIIVALFVTALIAAISIAMIDRLSTDTRRTALLLNHTQANLYAAGSVYWAMEQLINDYKSQQPRKLVDKTPIHSSVNDLNGAKIFSIIQDAQGKINLNNLNDLQFQWLFIRLIQLVDPKIEAMTAQNIGLAIANWITPGSSGFDLYYAKKNPPYRAPHRLMASVSELRMVKGMTADLYVKLLPYVTALPEQKTAINLNSAPIPVLMSLNPGISLEMAKAIVRFREQTPLTRLDQLGNFALLKESPIAKDNNLIFMSTYFMVQTHVIIGNQHLILHSLLMRLLKNAQPIVVILWQGTA